MLLLSISRTDLGKTRVGTQTQSYSVASKRTGTRLRFWELSESDSQLPSWNVPPPWNYPEELFQDNFCLTLCSLELYQFAKKNRLKNAILVERVIPKRPSHFLWNHHWLICSNSFFKICNSFLRSAMVFYWHSTSQLYKRIPPPSCLFCTNFLPRWVWADDGPRIFSNLHKLHH